MRSLAAFCGIIVLTCRADVPPSRFEVKTLPGWQDDSGIAKELPSRMFTGYIDAGTPPSGTGRMYFHYMMIEAEEKPEEAPVIVWYNGGPGASSLFGIFNEFGPLLLTEQSLDDNYLKTNIPTLISNPDRWSATHTLVAIDSPPPMGLSFCSEEGPTGGPKSCGPWSDKSVFRANHMAHKAFFTDIFPGLKSNPIFFAGESYGGMYVPGFVQELIDDPIPGLNFKGMLIGDGFVGCEPVEGKPANWCINLTNVGMFKYPNANPGPWYDIEFFHGHQQFSNELYREIIAKCPEPMLRGTKGENLSTTCASLIDKMAEEVGPFSAYNLYDNCPEDNPWTPPDFAGDAHGMFQSLRARRAAGRQSNPYLNELRAAQLQVKALKSKLGAGRPGESGTNSPCLANAMPLWFGQNASLKAIGAPEGIRFINLDNGIGFDYTTDQTFVGPIYERVIRKGFRVLVYEGDNDACGLSTSPNADVFTPLFDDCAGRTRPWRPFAVGEGKDEFLGGYVTEWGGPPSSPSEERARCFRPENGSNDAHTAKPDPVSPVLFVSIRGSGHMSPLNRPRVSHDMVKMFTHRQEFPDYKPGASSSNRAVYV